VPSNLTRDEARDRAELISVDSCQVELDLSGSDETFESITTVRFRSAWAGAATFLEPDDGASRPRALADHGGVAANGLADLAHQADARQLLE
jgi:hypothetical protein